jgi:hypothetical protein
MILDVPDNPAYTVFTHITPAYKFYSKTGHCTIKLTWTKTLVSLIPVYTTIIWNVSWHGIHLIKHEDKWFYTAYSAVPVVQFSNSAVNAANTSKKHICSTGLHLSYHLSENL